MLSISTKILQGSGTPPKSLALGTTVLLTLDTDVSGLVEWEIVAAPPNAVIALNGANSKIMRFGPIPAVGVYQLRAFVNRGLWNQKSRTISLSVPAVPGPLPTPPDPLFALGGAIRNFSFELPGSNPGEADEWATRDDASILATGGGTSRGRIIPTNFVVPSGLFAMCLGDDNHATATFAVGQVFAVSQVVDFTNGNVLKVKREVLYVGTRMATLPSFYVDNVRLMHSDTINVRGNRVSDISGGTVTGIHVHNCKNARIKDNQAVRLRTMAGISYGFVVNACHDVLLAYNVASRASIGFSLTSLEALNIYNLTAHDCSTCLQTDSSGTFRNIALSSYYGWHSYNNCNGIVASGGAVVDLDYARYIGISVPFTGSVSVGTNVLEEEILYVDEPNDDLTPDHISVLVNAGTANPLKTVTPDIGGIESIITTEVTADRKYQYSLLDNDFWDIDNDKSAEMSFIKAYQSRILANCESATKDVVNNAYVKYSNSSLKFSDLFPANAIYVNQSKFKKRVMDFWYATQNPAVLFSYNSGIGGYNLFPSFFQRMEDVIDAWIIGESYINEDNWILGYDGIKYGILIDVLGTSTLSQVTSGECYNNVQSSISDIATVRWNLHDEVQPSNYIMFTDMYNGYENCTLDNMIYNDDFAVEIDTVMQDGQVLTPLISTASLWASGAIPTDSTGASGLTEISLLDRVHSENIIRKIYYRQGDSSATMSSWTEIPIPISGYFSLISPYVQFRIDVSGVLRKIDYEFVGLCLRPFVRARDWAVVPAVVPVEDDDMSAFFHLLPGAYSTEIGKEPIVDGDCIQFPDDGVEHTAAWSIYIPVSWRTGHTLIERLVFSASVAGTAKIIVGIGTFNEASGASLVFNLISKDVIIPVPAPVGLATVDVDLSSYINANTTHAILGISRDSSVVGDALAGKLSFLNGRLLE